MIKFTEFKLRKSYELSIKFRTFKDMVMRSLSKWDTQVYVSNDKFTFHTVNGLSVSNFLEISLLFYAKNCKT